MAYIDGLNGAVASAEADATSQLAGLNANSSVADLTRAQFAMSKFQLVATAVSAIIKADGEMRQGTARNIAR